MKLKDYLSTLSPSARKTFADRCETTLGHLRNISYGYRPCGESLAIRIERESRGMSKCEENRPDVDWGVIRGTALSKKTGQALHK